MNKFGKTFHIGIDMQSVLRRGDRYLDGMLAIGDRQLTAAEVRKVFAEEIAKGRTRFCGCDNRDETGSCAGHES